MVKENKRRAVRKAVHGPPEDKGVKPVAERDPPEDEPQTTSEEETEETPAPEAEPPAEEAEAETAAEPEPAAEPDPEPTPEPPPKPPRAKKCPHCRAELFPHDPDGPKAGCAHCNSCGCCFGPDGKPRPGHPVCSLAPTE